MSNSDVHLIYVLLDGVGDLPHPDLDGKTPLEAANTPILDKIASNGSIGQVISVEKFPLNAKSPSLKSIPIPIASITPRPT